MPPERLTGLAFGRVPVVGSGRRDEAASNSGHGATSVSGWCVGRLGRPVPVRLDREVLVAMTLAGSDEADRTDSLH